MLSVLTNKPEAHEPGHPGRGSDSTRLFVAVVGGDSLPTRKPDPAGVEWLLAAGGTRRAELLLVGDSGHRRADGAGGGRRLLRRLVGAHAGDACGPSIRSGWSTTPSELLAVVDGAGLSRLAAPGRSSAAYSAP